jgi:hypothetical protein
MSIDPLLLALAQAEAMTYAPNAVPTWTDTSATWQVFHTVVNGINTFCWEGTMDFAEWLEDFNPLEEASKDIGLVHKPSLDNVRAVLPLITATLDGLGKPPCYLVGHSKGAREAPIAHAMLKEGGYRVLAGYYYEPPRAGGTMLREYLADQTIVATQTYNSSGSDIVTLVPEGSNWVDIRPLLRLKVSDGLSIRGKHIISGVLEGIANLGS